ncbi:hypothetical protein [Gallaecimonas pentaromativorans]|uniref:hypothetical protein n=1 Tax=Gallaecimonas pentaromativorans TaxID=584787 RepID=UPI003A8D44E2
MLAVNSPACRFSGVSCVLFLLVLATSQVVWADEEDISEDRQSTDLPGWAVERIDPVYNMVSGWVNSTSRNIDGFFGTDESLKVENHSYLRISQEFLLRQNRANDTDTGIRYRLQLPTTQERLKLIVESDPEETLGTLQQQAARDTRTGRFDGGQGAVIGLEKQEGEDKTVAWDNSFSGGVKLRLPPDPYLRFTSERLWQLGQSPWTLEFDGRLSWFNSDGFSARGLVDIGRHLDERHYLRFVSQVQWQEDYDHLEFYQRAEYNRIINRRSAIRYSAVVVGEGASDPRINDYFLETLYRRNIHKGFIFVDVAPSLHFPREVGFDPSWEVNLRLEVFFRGDIILKH